MADAYVRTLLNPFDTTFPQPKLLDGSETRSAGVRFRNVGNITLPVDGSANLIVLFPGYSYCLNWKAPTTDPSMPAINPSHLGTSTLRNDVRRVRLVSAGLKLSLENTSDDNEGNWEAVRIPVTLTDFQPTDTVGITGEYFGMRLVAAFDRSDLANHATYQTGRLRDIHRFLFKLNSVDPDHDFSQLNTFSGNYGGVSAGAATTLAETAYKSMLDTAFDVVVIRVTGRVDANQPSVLRYDVVSNQEVVYRDGTALGRLMSQNIMIPQMDVLLDRTRFQLPAIQVI